MSPVIDAAFVAAHNDKLARHVHHDYEHLGDQLARRDIDIETVRRQVAASIDTAVQTRREQAGLESGFGVCDERSNPEEDAIERQRVEIMKRVLHSISPRDREILTRFYLLNQTQEEICLEMHLTGTQFRLLKSRAKARFGELGRRRLRLGLFSQLILRLVSRSAH